MAYCGVWLLRVLPDARRASGGAGVRGALPLAVAGVGQRLRLGVDVHHQDDDRRNFENCVDRAAPLTVW